MRVLLLVVALFFYAFPVRANDLFYELCLAADDNLKTILTLRTLNKDIERTFGEYDQVILASENYGNYYLDIIPKHITASGIIPFGKWTITGIQKGGIRLGKPFATEKAEGQIIENFTTSSPDLGNRASEQIIKKMVSWYFVNVVQ